jgi:hypothetical protein
MRELLVVAVFLARPLMMIFMMRGGHGHSGHGHHDGHEAGVPTTKSSSELRLEREELDRLIEERAREEETPTPVSGGWR